MFELQGCALIVFEAFEVAFRFVVGGFVSKGGHGLIVDESGWGSASVSTIDCVFGGDEGGKFIAMDIVCNITIICRPVEVV